MNKVGNSDVMVVIVVSFDRCQSCSSVSAFGFSAEACKPGKEEKFEVRVARCWLANERRLVVDVSGVADDVLTLLLLLLLLLPLLPIGQGAMFVEMGFQVTTSK